MSKKVLLLLTDYRQCTLLAKLSKIVEFRTEVIDWVIFSMWLGFNSLWLLKVRNLEIIKNRWSKTAIGWMG